MNVILEILIYAVIVLFVFWYLVYVGKLIHKLISKSNINDTNNENL